MMVYYPYYSDSKGLMNLENFIKFYKEFSLFPDLISKPKIMTIFYTLSKIYDSTNEDKQESRNFSLKINKLFN